VTCQTLQCDTTVGYGGSPDENGETTLDALVMDGTNRQMGAVGALRRVKDAARVAWAVMNYTQHSFLVGDQGKVAFKNFYYWL
jgi:N4-(beta-N-acetylglucosaminyl)-L-asparaginase